MAATAVRVTVSDSATLVASGDVDGTDVCVRIPTGGATVYLGGDDEVTSSTGYALYGGEQLGVPLKKGEQLWGVTASSQVVHTLAAGVNSGSSGYPYS